MSRKKNIKALFSGEKPSGIQWFADLSWWYNAEIQKNTLPEKFKGDGVIELYKELGCGIYLPLVDVYKMHIDCKSKTIEGENIRTTTYFTPFGEIREVIRNLPDVFTINYDERLMKTSDDIKSLKYFFESIHFLPDYFDAMRLDKLYGEEGIVVACLPRTPLSRLVVECAGIEATSYAMYESPEEFKSLIEIMEKKDDEAYNIVCESPAEFVMFPDNLSSEMISPKMFSEFSLDYYVNRNSQLHQYKKYTMTHIDGTLKGLLPLLAKSGLDCVEGLTPYPIGDAKPSELRSLTNDEIILWGGIPSPMFTHNWCQENFKQYVLSYIEAMRTNPRFVVGVGDQVPPNSDMKRIKIVSDLVASFT